MVVLSGGMSKCSTSIVREEPKGFKASGDIYIIFIVLQEEEDVPIGSTGLKKPYVNQHVWTLMLI